MEKCMGQFFILDGKLTDCIKFNDRLLVEATNVYEVIRIINGKYLFIEEHIARMQQSAHVAGIQIGLSDIEVMQSLALLKQYNDITTGNVKFAFIISDKTRSFMAFEIRASYPGPEAYIHGINTKLMEAERINPNVKIFNPTLREKADKFIEDEGIYEALLVNHEGYVTEGNRSNVFFVEQNRVITPPLQQVLPGITRTHVIDICQRLQVPLNQEPVHTSALGRFNAVFLTGTSPKVLPVRKIGQYFYATQDAIVSRIMQSYNEEIDTYIYS